MAIRRMVSPWAWALAGCWVAWLGPAAQGQGPTIDPSGPTAPGGGSSTLGRSPGSGGSGPLGPDESILGGRVGPTTPKGVPTSISTPGLRSGSTLNEPSGIQPIAEQPAASMPVSGALSIPATAEDPGPEDGLTLEQALDRLLRENLDLRAKSVEIPMARADALTASLRANPVFYADAQLVPYGQYTRARPGGQTQYDVNISYPLDITGKRKARTAEACIATRVIEAQYQDAARQAVDNLYSGFVDILQARRTIAFAEAGLDGLDRALHAIEDLAQRGIKRPADVARVRIQRKLAEQQLLESREAYTKSKRAMAALLNLPAEQADALEVRGTLRYPGIDPPPLAQMLDTALRTRPDVNAYRIGVRRAEASVKTQMANRLQDVYLLYQPYTLQDNTPFGLKSPTSWAVGVTVPLPVFNRNQGNIQRARDNVGQTRVELAAEERQVIQDVQAAEREYATARLGVERIEKEILPDSNLLLQDAIRLFPSEIEVLEYLAAFREYNENARAYLDGQVRLRRAMLEINTAVGQRLLP